MFEHIAIHCQKFSDLIPVTFVLGFYVSIIITRCCTLLKSWTNLPQCNVNLRGY
jgi:hypothetical protein